MTNSEAGRSIRAEFCHAVQFRNWCKAAAILGLITALYSPVLSQLLSDCWNHPDYSHALLVPPLALYIAWSRRSVTLAESAVPDGRGIVLVTAACLIFLVGKLGAELFLTRVSLVVLLAGLVWTFTGARRLRTLAFPLILVVSMVPLPALLYNLIAAPLQLLASSLSTQLVELAGVPVYREGNVIHLPGISLGVAEACSGLRSLSSLTVMALLAGFLQCSRLLARAALFVLAIPIAIGLNILRISATAFLVEKNPEMAVGFYHSFSGWLLFLAGVGLILALARALREALERKTLQG